MGARNFFVFRANRIGHLCYNTETFLLDKTRYNPNDTYVGVTDGDVCNKTVLLLLSRVFCERVVNSKVLAGVLYHVQRMTGSKRIVYHGVFDPFRYDLFKQGSCVGFTRDEKRRGVECLRRMGVDSWFVCFHARDSSYLNVCEGGDCGYHGYRDFDIERMVPAMEYVARMGGYAIRMGAVVEKPLTISNSHIIDYAVKYRNDFCDVFLPSKAKFFVGGPSGFINVAYLFRTPVVETNVTPLEAVGVPYDGLFIPKLVYSDVEHRYLSFREIVDGGMSRFQRGDQFDMLSLVNVENTPGEILDVTVEMNSRLDGVWREEHDDLQRMYWSLFKRDAWCYGCPARVGSRFLHDHRVLLPGQGNEKICVS